MPETMKISRVELHSCRVDNEKKTKTRKEQNQLKANLLKNLIESGKFIRWILNQLS
jgi:hypothetical protein